MFTSQLTKGLRSSQGLRSHPTTCSPQKANTESCQRGCSGHWGRRKWVSPPMPSGAVPSVPGGGEEQGTLGRSTQHWPGHKDGSTATWHFHPAFKLGFGGLLLFLNKHNNPTAPPAIPKPPSPFLFAPRPPACSPTGHQQKKWPGCQLLFFPTRPAMLATAVPASLREASVLRGPCGACSTASISLHSSGVASLSLNISAPPKSLSHPLLTLVLPTALTSPTLSWHPSLRTCIYIPGPITLLYSRSLFSLCLRPSPFSCLEHISNPTCPKPQPVTKYTGWFKSNWTPSKSYQTMWFLPVESDPDTGFAPPLPPSLKTALGLPQATSSTDGKNAVRSLSWDTGVRTEPFLRDYRGNHDGSFTNWCTDILT